MEENEVKVEKMEMENRRGLFLSNIMSKCVEKLLPNRRKEEIESKFQCEVKGKSTADHLFMLSSVIDEYR